MTFLYDFIAGFLALFIAQLIFNYNFSDWVKDHVLSLLGVVESTAHAEYQRAISALAKAGKKLEFWKKAN